MRLPSLVASASLFCLASVALAYSAPGKAVDACCCCDIRRNVISCTRAIPKRDCVCAAVACPPNAKTVWDNHKHPRTTLEDSKTTSLPVEGETRTSPVSLPVQKATGTMSTTDAHQTQTATKAWDPDQTTINQDDPLFTKPIYPFSSELPGKVLTMVGYAEKRSERTNQAAGGFSCCCCDIAVGKVVCEARDMDDCVCAMVICPQNAETIFATPPAPTGI
ncbi:hypothetical protein E4U53_002836 [Claviceps sorghi]|nr:hypothetical protein E4U53_002836 [Claviceps sorghi]